MAETLLALSPEALVERIVSLGGRPFHARVARKAVFEKGALDYDGMTSLPAALRERLTAELPILAGREAARIDARDATTKLLIAFPGTPGTAEATVETVHMPSLYKDDATQAEDLRPKQQKGATLCVSTQVGCPVACPFCASGKLGLTRNLEAHEILEQFVRGRALGKVSRAVVMGIGEPLLNYDALSTALDVVHDELGLGARKVTVSTVGFPERLRRIAPDKPRFQLAISLHTPFDEERAVLVPAMKDVPIEDVLAAGDHWFETTGREVTYEVVLLGGDNDTPDHAQRLAERLQRRRCTVNLIPFNPIDDAGYRRPAPPAVDLFKETLTSAGVVATVRWSRGLETDAACGQLRARRTAGP
jgi:23S rRNA (adenine2503-C2)-methyltransferase